MSRSISLSAFFIGAGAMAFGQTPEPLWPQQAFGFSYGLSAQAPLVPFNEQGKDRDFHANGVRSGFGFEYSLCLRNKLVLGVQAQAASTSWRYSLSPDPPFQGTLRTPGLGMPSRYIFAPFVEFDHLEYLAFAGKRFHESRRWSVDAGLLAGAIGKWSSQLIKGYEFSFPGDSLGFASVLVVEGLDIFPVLGFRANLNWQARNFNRWIIAIEGRWSITNYYGGGYVLYQDTPEESSGELKGRLACIGLRIGYAFTWGAPRKPRWMRRLEERGLAPAP